MPRSCCCWAAVPAPALWLAALGGSCLAAWRWGFLAETREFAALLEEETRRGACVSLKDLAVNGADLLKLGYAPGPALGAALNGLLARVVDGSLENRREVLLAAAVDMKRAAAP